MSSLNKHRGDVGGESGSRSQTRPSSALASPDDLLGVLPCPRCWEGCSSFPTAEMPRRTSLPRGTRSRTFGIQLLLPLGAPLPRPAQFPELLESAFSAILKIGEAQMWQTLFPGNADHPHAVIFLSPWECRLCLQSNGSRASNQLSHTGPVAESALVLQVLHLCPLFSSLLSLPILSIIPEVQPSQKRPQSIL